MKQSPVANKTESIAKKKEEDSPSLGTESSLQTSPSCLWTESILPSNWVHPAFKPSPSCFWTKPSLHSNWAQSSLWTKPSPAFELSPVQPLNQAQSSLWTKPSPAFKPSPVQLSSQAQTSLWTKPSLQEPVQPPGTSQTSVNQSNLREPVESLGNKSKHHMSPSIAWVQALHKSKCCMSPSVAWVQALHKSSITQVHFWAGIVRFDTFGSLGDSHDFLVAEIGTVSQIPSVKTKRADFCWLIKVKMAKVLQ